MKKTAFIFTILLLASCTSNTILEKPKDLIPKDTMAFLLRDLFITKSAAIEKNLNNEQKINYVPLIYNIYKIDSTRFITSNLYYTSKIEEYDLIYKEAKRLLTVKKLALEKNLKSKKKEEKSTLVDDIDFEDKQ